MAPKLILLMSPSSKKKEPRYARLSEANASHSLRMWVEVSSSTPHLLHKGLSSSPNSWRCLLSVLCPVRRPVTTLDWVLFKDKYLVLAARLGPEINSQACLWVPSRPRHLAQCWLVNQRLSLLLDLVYYLAYYWSTMLWKLALLPSSGCGDWIMCLLWRTV